MNAPTLSRALLAVDGRRAPRGSTEPYLLHQSVADLFGDRSDRGYLFRVLRERPGGREVLILSDGAPLPPAEVPVRPWGGAVHVESKPFAPRIAAGASLDFELRLNATRQVTEEDGRRSRQDVWNAVFAADRRDPRTPHEVYGAYLRRKLEGAAEVLEARVTERGEVKALRWNPRRSVLFVAANLVGSLRVEDPDRLVQAMTAGIGRSKAFGCGLLCLSRPGSVLRRSAAGTGEP